LSRGPISLTVPLAFRKTTRLSRHRPPGHWPTATTSWPWPAISPRSRHHLRKRPASGNPRL